MYYFYQLKFFNTIIQHITNLTTGSLSGTPSKILKQNMAPWNLNGYTLDGLKIGRYLAEKGTANFGAQVMGYSDLDVYYYIYFDNAGIAEKIRLKRIA